MHKFYAMIMLIAIPSLLVGAAPEDDIYGYSSFFKAPWSTIIGQIETGERKINEPLSKSDKRSLLILAAHCENQAVVNKLIQLGANVRDGHALHFTIGWIVFNKEPYKTKRFKKYFEQYFNILTTLIEHGADKTIGQYYIKDINALPLAYKHRLEQLLDLDPEQREQQSSVPQPQLTELTPYMIKVINFTTKLKANGNTPAHIKKAYNRLVLQHHPDKGGGMEDFKALKAACEGLMENMKDNSHSH